MTQLHRACEDSRSRAESQEEEVAEEKKKRGRGRQGEKKRESCTCWSEIEEGNGARFRFRSSLSLWLFAPPLSSIFAFAIWKIHWISNLCTARSRLLYYLSYVFFSFFFVRSRPKPKKVTFSPNGMSKVFYNKKDVAGVRAGCAMKEKKIACRREPKAM